MMHWRVHYMRLPWQCKAFQLIGSQTARRYYLLAPPKTWKCRLDGPCNTPLSQEVWSMTPGLNYWSPGWRCWAELSQALLTCRGGRFINRRPRWQFEIKKHRWPVRVLLVYWEVHFASPSMPSAALAETQKVQLVPGVSSEISTASPVRVVFWKPQPVVFTKYVYSFLNSSGSIQTRRTAVVFKVSASSCLTLNGPTNRAESVCWISNSLLKQKLNLFNCYLLWLFCSFKIGFAIETASRIGCSVYIRVK